MTCATRGSFPKLSTIRAIRLRSFSIIWCSSAARISSPWARAVLLSAAISVRKWWTE